MSRGRKGRPVMCVETGQVFPSITKAAEWMGAEPSGIIQVVNGYTKTAGGYHWQYINTEQEATPKPHKPRSAPSMTIEEVQAEAARRTRETGRYTRYAHIQIEETLALARNQVIVHKPKKKRRAKR